VTVQVKTELGHTYTTTYGYDSGDRVVSITYPDNRVVSYSRDNVGRLTGVNATVNGVSVPIATGRTYRADGLLLTQTYGNGLNEARSYDTQGHLTYQSLGTADTRVYAYDANGNLTQKQSLPDVASYGYDALDRLVNEVTTLSTNAYTYDGNGNRTSGLLPNGNTQSYSYSPNTNRLVQKGNQVFRISDRNENRVFGYNEAGRLTEVTRQGTLRGTYTYNHQFQRTRKVKVTNTGVTKTFVYHSVIHATIHCAISIRWD